MIQDGDNDPHDIPELSMPTDVLRKIANSKNERFDLLAEEAGLDPSIDFAFMDLRQADFSGADIDRFNFEGAKIPTIITYTEKYIEDFKQNLVRQVDHIYFFVKTDLNSAVDTLLSAGKAKFLHDKTGEAAEAALDGLIYEREAARGRIAKDEAALYRQKGALAFLHDTETALAAYTKAADLDPDNADGWNGLGHLLKRVGELDRAVDAYNRVLALGNKSANRATIAAATGNLGNIYKTKGDLEKAEQFHNQSLEINKALGRKEGMAADYGNLGLIYKTKGDLEKAEQFHNQSLEINKALGIKEGMASQTTQTSGSSTKPKATSKRLSSSTTKASKSIKRWAEKREWQQTTETSGSSTKPKATSKRLNSS